MVKEKKRIAIASCYYQPNYGSMLQALATQMAIDKLGYTNETIDISGLKKEIRKAKVKYFFIASLTSGLLLTKFGRVKNVIRKKVFHGKYFQNVEKRDRKFREFRDKHFRLSRSYPSMMALRKACEDYYSDVLVGSDQLWLPGNIAADYFTLNWVPEGINTIAYATSFGQSELPKDILEKASFFLRRINHIGVREESGKELVKRIANRDVPVVCDPTLLFTDDDWQIIQDEEPLVSGEYIFCYFLGSNKQHRQFAKRIKEETGCKIVILPHIDEYVRADEEIGDELLYEIDPGGFLNLIKYSKYVCTDSFHCTLFSIIYKRNFFTFRRFSSTNKHSTNSRLDTLFDLTGITGRLVEGNERICECLHSQIDYELVMERLSKERKKSYKYLFDSINNY